MCRIDDCDTPSVYRVENRRGAKAHECCECRRIIEKGEMHKYYFMIVDGESLTFRLCRHCEAAAGWLVRECGGFMLDQVAEELIEHAEEYPHCASGLAPLISGIRSKWQGDGELMPLPEVPAVKISEIMRAEAQ